MRVALFVTCLVDLLRPSVGFSAIRLLEAGGCTVCVPDTQTCCEQPGFNSGDRMAARALARKVIADAESGIVELVIIARAALASTWLAVRPGYDALATKVARRYLPWLAGGRERLHHLAVAPDWSKGRDFPAPQGRTFRDLYASQQQTHYKGP